MAKSKSKSGEVKKKVVEKPKRKSRSKGIQTNTAEIVRKLKNVYYEITSYFVERDDLVEMVLLAILSRQHVYILGPPGTAKSAIARAVSAHLDANYFEYLINRFTTPEELFGPVDLKKIEEGEFVRVTASKLPEAEIAFLDEVFKGNSAILNDLLTLINERVFHNGTKTMRVPLNTLVTASNELPEDENELGAFYDRLLIRCTVDYIRSDEDFKDMLRGGEEYAPKTKISMDEIRVLQGELGRVDVEPVLDTIVELRKKLRKEGITASDRRFKQALSVVRAHAVFNGRAVATSDDLKVLQHIMWDTPDQIPTVKRLVLDVVDPYAKKIFEYKEILREMREIVQHGTNGTDTGEILQKLKVVEDEIKDLINLAISSNRDTEDMEDLLTEIQELKIEMIDKVYS